MSTDHPLSFLTRTNAPAPPLSTTLAPPPSATGGARRSIERHHQHRPFAEVEDDPELLARWDRIGLSSGHVWAPCDACGQSIMLPRSGGRRCAVTFGCPGSHRVPPNRPTPLQALKSGVISIDDLRRHPPELNDTLRRLLAPTPATEADTPGPVCPSPATLAGAMDDRSPIREKGL